MQISIKNDLKVEETASTPSLISHSWHKHWYWPWGKQKKSSHTNVKTTQGVEIDGNLIVGGIEIAVGLSVIICYGITPVGAISGGSLMADGVKRIADRGQSDFDKWMKDRQSQADSSKGVYLDGLEIVGVNF